MRPLALVLFLLAIACSAQAQETFFPAPDGSAGARVVTIYSALDAPVAEFVRLWEGAEDPETAYALAPMLSYCGRPQDALRFVKRAVDGGFCVYPGFDLDPIWATLRSDPEFQRMRTAGLACHERFRGAVKAYDAQPSNQ